MPTESETGPSPAPLSASALFETSYTNELVSRSSRSERDRLLSFSMLGIALSILKPSEIKISDAKITGFSVTFLLLGISIIILYYFISFAFAAYMDRIRFSSAFGIGWRAYRAEYLASHNAKSQRLTGMIGEYVNFNSLLADFAALRAELTTLEEKQVEENQRAFDAQIAQGLLPVVNISPLPRTLEMSKIEEKIEAMKWFIAQEKGKQPTQEAVAAIDFVGDANEARRHLRTIKKLWAIQNIWMILVPLLFGMFAEMILALQIVRH